VSVLTRESRKSPHTKHSEPAYKYRLRPWALSKHIVTRKQDHSATRPRQARARVNRLKYLYVENKNEPQRENCIVEPGKSK
jgi:hypothetical protein